MTKYVLNSGGLKNKPEKAKKFFNEVFKGLGQNPKVLVCLFAQPREDWEFKFQKEEEYFKDAFGDVVLFMAFPDEFEQQIKENDVIYIKGGDDHLLQYWLKQYDLPAMWQDKIVVGSSAGSDALVKSFWTCDWRQCMDGLGLVPIKFIPHYKSTEYGKDDPRGLIDWEKAYIDLRGYGDVNLPIYAPEEGDYQVFEID